MFRLSRKVARMRSIEDGRPGKSRRRRIVDIRPASERAGPLHLGGLSEPPLPLRQGLDSDAQHRGRQLFPAFIIHQAPGPALAVQPTVELAKRNSRQRIDPLIEESPALRDKVKPRARATPATPCCRRSSPAAS